MQPFSGNMHSSLRNGVSDPLHAKGNRHEEEASTQGQTLSKAHPCKEGQEEVIDAEAYVSIDPETNACTWIIRYIDWSRMIGGEERHPTKRKLIESMRKLLKGEGH